MKKFSLIYQINCFKCIDDLMDKLLLLICHCKFGKNAKNSRLTQ